MALALDCGERPLDPPPATISDSCTSALGYRLGMVAGTQAPCATLLPVLDAYAQEYQARWGGSLSGWEVRVFPGASLPESGNGSWYTGMTYWNEGVIEITETFPDSLPHEMHHQQLGRDSWNHTGWCTSFSPWEIQTLGRDERANLGCPQS